MTTDLVRTSFHCTADLLARLREIAEQEDRTVAWLVRSAVEEYLDRHDGRADEYTCGDIPGPQVA